MARIPIASFVQNDLTPTREQAAALLELAYLVTTYDRRLDKGAAQGIPWFGCPVVRRVRSRS